MYDNRALLNSVVVQYRKIDGWRKENEYKIRY